MNYLEADYGADMFSTELSKQLIQAYSFIPENLITVKNLPNKGRSGPSPDNLFLEQINRSIDRSTSSDHKNALQQKFSNLLSFTDTSVFFQEYAIRMFGEVYDHGRNIDPSNEVPYDLYLLYPQRTMIVILGLDEKNSLGVADPFKAQLIEDRIFNSAKEVFEEINQDEKADVYGYNDFLKRLIPSWKKALEQRNKTST